MADDKTEYINGMPVLGTVEYVNGLPVIGTTSAQAASKPQSLNAQYGKRDDMLGTIGRWGMQGSQIARSAIGQGTAFGFGDEIEAAIKAPFTDKTYAQELETARGKIDAYRRNNPNAALANEIAGGIISPALGAKAVYGAAKQLPKLQRIAQTAARGGAGAALDGFGQGQDGFMNRAASAGLSGLMGGGMSGGMALLAEALGPVVKKVLPSSRAATKQLTPEEALLARKLRDVPDEVIAEGQIAGRQAVQDGTPMFLPEMLDDVEGYDAAKFYRNNADTKRIASNAIDARDARLVDDLKDEFTTRISSEVDSAKAGRRMKRAADTYMTEAKVRRAEAVNKLYGKAYKESPTINDPAVTDLIKGEGSNPLKREIRKLRELPEYADLPENSIKLIHSAKSRVQDAIQTMDPNAANDMRKFLAPVQRALKESSPEFAKADKRYARFSRAISSIDDGIIGELARAKTAKESAIGSKILSKKASEIKALKRSFKGKEDELKALLRSHYEDILDKTPRNLDSAGKRNPLPKLAATKQQRDVITELLGEKEGNELFKFLESQDRMLKGRTRYQIGSDTNENMKLEQRFGGSGGVSRFVKNPFSNAFEFLEEALSLDAPATKEAAARILFNPDPRVGADALDKLGRAAPALRTNPETMALIDALGSGAGRGVAADQRRQQRIPELYITPPKQ